MRPAIPVIRQLVLGATMALLLAACAAPGPDGPVDNGDPSQPVAEPGGMAALVVSEGGGGGPALSVVEALEHRATDDLLSVTGALFVDPEGTVLLCEAIAESFPPQCGGSRLEVEELDLSSIDSLEEANGVRWSESVVLFGSVE
jgi:hypothetical protein